MSRVFLSFGRPLASYDSSIRIGITNSARTENHFPSIKGGSSRPYEIIPRPSLLSLRSKPKHHQSQIRLQSYLYTNRDPVTSMFRTHFQQLSNRISSPIHKANTDKDRVADMSPLAPFFPQFYSILLTLPSPLSLSGDQFPTCVRSNIQRGPRDHRVTCIVLRDVCSESLPCPSCDDHVVLRLGNT